MAWERHTLNNYLYGEFRFWKSLKAVYVNGGSKDKTLLVLKKRFADDKVEKMAEARFRSMAALFRVFKKEHLDAIRDRVNKELGSTFKDPFNWDEIRQFKPKPQPGRGGLAYGWDVVIAIAVVIVVIAIAYAAEKNDNNGVQEDDTLIVTVGSEALAQLVETASYLKCEEILNLNYATWTTYLLMVKTVGDSAHYAEALICAPCANLQALCTSFGYRHDLIMPPDVTWLAWFLYAARLSECNIPY
jgi:hypothetical protein